MREPGRADGFSDIATPVVRDVVMVGETQASVWVVDDDQSIRWVLTRALSRVGFQVRSFPVAAEALAALEEGGPDVVVSDIRMPGASGIELLYQLRQWRRSLPVIIMTAYSDLDSAVSTFQAGAFDYLPKPFDLVQAVEMVRRAAQVSTLARGPRGDVADSAVAVGKDSGILGRAPSMQAVFRAIGRLSQSAATVLVTGESGSGKELVARALHRHSARADRPFVALNMAAIPRDLLESELFGHERGAFTGAQSMRRGRFEQAEGGTLFLDEIGDMPAELQTRLLRVLSEGSFYRVGGSEPVQSSVRVIAATHQDLETRVSAGLFRGDLFHRLNVIRLRLPPLRERVEDIPVLARHFLGVSARSMGMESKQLSVPALQALAAYSWPGNVRQLENVCHWLTVMTAAPVIMPDDLPPEISEGNGLGEHVDVIQAKEDVALVGELERERQSAVHLSGDVSLVQMTDWTRALAQTVRQLLADATVQDVMPRLGQIFERTLMQEALQHTGGQRAEAARRLGIGRNTMTRKIRDLGLDDVI